MEMSLNLQGTGRSTPTVGLHVAVRRALVVVMIPVLVALLYAALPLPSQPSSAVAERAIVLDTACSPFGALASCVSAGE